MAGPRNQALPYREGAGDIRATLIGRELDLRAGCATPAERFHDRRSQMARDFVCLVESAVVFASPMKRDRHDAIHVLQEISATLAHPFCQWPRQRNTAGVLQGMNDLAQCALVLAHRPCAYDGLTARLSNSHNARQREATDRRICRRAAE